jgi:hypothetical protein
MISMKMKNYVVLHYDVWQSAGGFDSLEKV